MRRRDEATPKPKKPTLAEQYAAQVAARGGYKPLTGKSTGEYLQPDTNMYNAGPMDVLRGINNMVGRVGDFLVVEPAKSLGRTLSTRNIQTVFNPKSSLTERANALTEDVLNVASLVPTFKGAAAAADAASMARYYNRLPAIQAEQRAAWDAYEGAVREAYDKAKQLPGTRLMLPSGKPGPLVPAPPPRQVRDELARMMPNFPKPPAVKPTRYELARQKAENLKQNVMDTSGWRTSKEEPTFVPELEDPENFIRLWHTHQEGLPLPDRLNPWENYIGVNQADERRGGNPMGNILSSGLYTTDSRPVSRGYATTPVVREAKGYKATGSYVPAGLSPTEIQLDDLIDLNTPVSKIPQLDGLLTNAVRDPYGYVNNRPFMMREKTRMSTYPAVPRQDDIVFDAEDLNVSKWNFGGKNPEEITLLDLLNAAPNEQAARAVIMFMDKPLAATTTVRTRYPLFRNPGGATSRIAHGSPDVPAVLIENEARSRGGMMSTLKDEPTREMLYRMGENTYRVRSGPYKNSRLESFDKMFPYNTPHSGHVEMSGYPAQNYFDLPIKRDPTTGRIDEVGGMKALDLGRFTPEQKTELAEATTNWLLSKGANPQSELFDDVVLRLRHLDPSGNKLDFITFQRLQDEIGNLLYETTGTIDGRNEWYKMLKDDLGYEVFPHPGGINAGGSFDPTHQAIVFNAPEKLPPANYSPASFGENLNETTAKRTNEYLRELAVANMYQPGKRLGRDFSNRMDQRMLNMAKRASISPISSYAQNLAGNR